MNMDQQRPHGPRRVLVTGGTRGIGHAIAMRFLADGADVVVCARSEPPRSSDQDLHPRPRFVAGDLRDATQAAGTVDRAVELLGGLDLVVNNAGGSPPADAATVSPRFVEKVVALNLLAPFYVAQRANDWMQRAGQGHIINIGSVSGRIPAPGTAAYSAAKAGLTQLTRALALEWGPAVRVNQLTVGLVRTELTEMHYGDESAVRALEDRIPLGRMATPADVAEACAALAAPSLAYLSGADLLLDGGGEIPPRSIGPQTDGAM